MNKTTIKLAKNVSRQWYLADASNFILGRLATKAATILIGKQHPDYTPFVDMGDYVVITNAGKIKVTGKKLRQKKYTRFSGYPGGITTTYLHELIGSHPEQVIREAVRRMLPKNKLGKLQLRRLKIFKDAVHPYQIHKTIV